MKKALLFIGLFMVLLTVGSALANPTNQTTPENDNQGIPQRVALVEEVLKVHEVLEITNQSEIDVKGTDYVPNDIGKLQVYLSVGDFPITTATCFASVLYPNMTYFIEHQLMLHANVTYFEGLYYYDFVVPETTGVYPVNAICQFDTDILIDYVELVSFDGLGEATGTDILNLRKDDGLDYEIQDFASCNGINCSANYTINLPIGWRTGQIAVSRLLIEAEQTKNKDVYWYVHSNTTGERFHWFTMSSAGVPYMEQFDLNASFANDTYVTVEMVGVDFQASKMNIDYLFGERSYAGSVVNDLRGNEELVVSKGIYNMTVTVQEIAGAEINVVPDVQLEQVLIIIVFMLLLFAGYLIPASMLGLAYSFLYLDGLFTIIGAGICALILIGGYKRYRDNK